MPIAPYTHFADLVRKPGDRARFHWTPLVDAVLIISVDSSGGVVDTKTMTLEAGREFWSWLLNAGWEPYGIPIIGRGSQDNV